MAIFLGAHDDDIQEWRGVAELLAGLRGMTAEKMAGQLAGENVLLLRELLHRLDAEIDFEERFAAEFKRLMDRLDQERSPDEFATIRLSFSRLVQDYFRERGSATAVHSLCGTYRDALVRKALQWVEDSLAADGMGRPPAPYCWLAGGSAGRQEQTFCIDSDFYLIYGAEDDVPGYFEKFSCRAAALLGKIGLLPENGGAAAVKTLWRGGRTAWRKEVVEKFLPRERKGIEAFLERADLRLIQGDAGLADEMLNVVRSMLGFHHDELREAAVGPDLSPRFRTAVSRPVPLFLSISRTVAEAAAGLDIFGRFKVEKKGRHRGMFALNLHALAPLIAHVRVLALEFGLNETGTAARIKGLQEAGRLSVELAERLLRAFHDFSRMEIRRQIESGCENDRACYIDARELPEHEEKRLKAGLAAVTDLEKIVYLCFTEQG